MNDGVIEWKTIVLTDKEVEIDKNKIQILFHGMSFTLRMNETFYAKDAAIAQKWHEEITQTL